MENRTATNSNCSKCDYAPERSVELNNIREFISSGKFRPLSARGPSGPAPGPSGPAPAAGPSGPPPQEEEKEDTSWMVDHRTDDDGTEWAQSEDETWYYREAGQSDWVEWQD